MTRRSPNAADPTLRSLLWRLVGRWLYRWSFHNFYRLRHALLVLHGARLGPNTKFRRTVRIDRPWNLGAGELAMIGDHAVLHARAPLTIGDRSVVSQLAVITTEVRDPAQSGHPSTAAPIVIEDDCWVAADCLVLPGSIVRAGTVIGARSVVEGELPAGCVAVGDPAVPRRRRYWRIGDRLAPVADDADDPADSSSVD
ncbi:MAG: colanic acid biosynthesis acetyltransferase WcaF [Planctomycetota bacterium]|nr:colanic acid biosynthesis acetyltransferase WcaF [Planctomycetota bacterium]